MSENREKEYFYLVYPRRIPDAQLDKVMQTTKILDSYTGQLQDRETEVYKIKKKLMLYKYGIRVREVWIAQSSKFGKCAALILTKCKVYDTMIG